MYFGCVSQSHARALSEGRARGPYDCGSVSLSPRLVISDVAIRCMAGKRRHYRRAGAAAAATGSRRLWDRCGAAEAAGKWTGAARPPAGARRSRHGWSCLPRGGALRARVRERAGHSAAVQVRARPAKQQHEPTRPTCSKRPSLTRMQRNGPRESNDERQEARACRCHTRRRLQKNRPASAPLLLRKPCSRIVICKTTLSMCHVYH